MSFSMVSPLLVVAGVACWSLGQLLQPGDPPEVMEGAQRLLAGHRRKILIALACAVLVLLALKWWVGRAYPMPIMWAFNLVCGALILRLEWRLRELRIAHTSVRTAYLVVNEIDQLPRWPWYTAIVVLSFAAAYLIAMWGQIPSRFPVHWNYAGEPDGWSERTIWSVFRPLLIGLGAVTSVYGLQRFQRWFLRRQWSTFGHMMRVRRFLELRAITYSSCWLALGSAAVAVSLPFAARLDLRIIAAAIVCYLGIPGVAALTLRSAGKKQASSE